MTGPVRRGLAIGGAGVALIGALMVARDEAPEATAARRPARGATRASSTKDVPVVDVRLELLRGTPTALEDVERNLFRFKSTPAPPPPPDADAAPRGGSAAPPPPAPVAAGPPALPPIPLKYIGLLEAPSQAGRVAILSDGSGNTFYGKEGDIIEGRYLMLRVGPISAELSYLDGRGRQTIRLSGQ